MHHCATLPMFLIPKDNYLQRAIPWWLQKQLIHGVPSSESQLGFLGLPLQCNSSGPAADLECLHIQKWILLFVFAAMPRMCLASLYPSAIWLPALKNSNPNLLGSRNLRRSGTGPTRIHSKIQVMANMIMSLSNWSQAWSWHCRLFA